jgi:hypothetical protein
VEGHRVSGRLGTYRNSPVALVQWDPPLHLLLFPVLVAILLTLSYWWRNRTNHLVLAMPGANDFIFI